MARYYDGERWVSMDDQEAQGVGSALDMWNQGYFSDLGALNQGQYTSGAGGQSFPDTLSYLNYLYGGNITPETIDGQTWYKVDNLAQGPQAGATPITYNPPPSMGSQLALGAIGAMAGAGLMNGFGAPVDASWGVNPAVEGAAAGDFSLAGATAGNPAGGLYSGASGLGLNPASAGLGFTPSDALVAGMANGTSNALLTPAIAGAAGIPAATNILTGAVQSAPSAATAMGGAATAAPATTAATSALSRIMDGTATASDWTSVLGNLGATGLGLAGANSQTNALKDVYNQQMSLGAPYRDMLAQSYQPGFSMANQPDFQNALNLGADAVARATSTKANTFDPGAQMEMNKYVSGNLALPALQNYRSQLGTFGQLGTNTAGAAALGGAQSQGGTYNALGYGLGQLTQPDNPFKGLLSQFGKFSF